MLSLRAAYDPPARVARPGARVGFLTTPLAFLAARAGYLRVRDPHVVDVGFGEVDPVDIRRANRHADLFAGVGAAPSVVRDVDAALRAISSWSEVQRQVALSVMDLESGFGVSGSWVLGDGAPSYNMGAITCNAYRKGTAGCFKHGDYTASGEPTTYSFMANETLEDGAAAFRDVWGRSDTLAAAATGDARAVAAAMYGHGYFTGVKGSAADRIDLYARAIVGASRGVAAALGQANRVYLGAAGGGAATDGFAWWQYAMVGLFVAGAGAYAFGR